MSDPMVSIVVPIYNAELYLNKCVDSLIAQTYTNIEIILVDDGSTDGSGSICDKYTLKDDRVRTVHRCNGGLSAARRSGLSEAKGAYVCIVDSDDWIDLNTIEVCVCRAIKANADCVMFSYVKEYGERSIVAHVMDGDQSFVGLDAEDKVYRRLFGLLGIELQHPERMENVVSCCMKLYRSEFAQKAKFFDVKEVGSCEDGLFNMYALHGADRIEYIDEPFYHYWKNPQSLTNTFRPNLVKQWARLFDVMENIIKEKELDSKYNVALDSRIVMSIYGIGTNELMNSISVIKKIQNIHNYLCMERYRNAIKQFDFAELPLIWKIFLGCCKYRLAGAVYLQLVVMQFLKKRY